MKISILLEVMMKCHAGGILIQHNHDAKILSPIFTASIKHQTSGICAYIFIFTAHNYHKE